MRLVPLLALIALLFACTQASLHHSGREGDRAEVTFHVLGLQKTPSGAT